VFSVSSVVEIFSIHEPSLLLPCLKGKRAWLFPSLIAVYPSREMRTFLSNFWIGYFVR